MHNTNPIVTTAISAFPCIQKPLLFCIFFLKRVDTLELYLGLFKCVKTAQVKLTCQMWL